MDKVVKLGGEYQSRSGLVSSNPQWVTGSEFSNRTDSVIKGTNWPSYKQRLKNGLPTTTSLVGNRFTYQGQPIDVQFYWRNILPFGSFDDRVYGTRGDFYAEYIVIPVEATGMSINSANNAALRRLNSEIKAAYRYMQGSVFIGELSEALRMIRNPFKILETDIFRWLRNLPVKKFRGGSVRQVHKRVSDAWLENSFGWQPFMHDIDDGVRALASLSAVTPPHKTVHGRGKDNKLTYEGSIIPPLNCDAEGSKWLEESVSVKYHGSVWLEQPSNMTTLHRFGISLSDVLPAVWELIPYSFLADYFTNLGDIIEAYTVNTSSIRWLERGIKRESKRTLRFNVSIRPTNPTIYKLEVISNVGSGVNTASCANVERINYTGGSLIPTFQFEIPGMSMKWLNLAALAVTHDRKRYAIYG